MVTAWKVSKNGVISGLYFPVFGLNTKRFSISLRIQFECGKIRTSNNSVFGHFSRKWLLSELVLILILFFSRSVGKNYHPHPPRYIL